MFGRRLQSEMGKKCYDLIHFNCGQVFGWSLKANLRKCKYDSFSSHFILISTLICSYNIQKGKGFFFKNDCLKLLELVRCVCVCVCARATIECWQKAWYIIPCNICMCPVVRGSSGECCMPAGLCSTFKCQIDLQVSTHNQNYPVKKPH